jgi:hypothetical protein
MFDPTSRFLPEFVKRTGEPIVALGFYAILTLAFGLPILLSGDSFYAFDILPRVLPWSASGFDSPVNNMLISDPLVHGLPATQLLSEGLRSGNLPFWNPWLFSGTLNEPSTYPLQILFIYLFEPIVAHDVSLLVHLLASGFLFHTWCRMQGIALTAAFFGGTAWMFNGYLMVWFEWEFVTHAAALLPLTLISLERILREQNVTNLLFLALSLALLINLGFYQITVYSFVFLTAYGTYRLCAMPYSHTVMARLSASVLAAAVLSVLLSTPFFIPKITAMLAAADAVQRPQFSYAELITTVSHLEFTHLLLLVFPDFLSNPARLPIVPFPGQFTYLYNNFNELCLYAGVPVVILAFSGLANWRDAETRFFGLAALVILLMLSGTYLYYPLFLLPGLDMTTPNRLLFIFALCFSMLATRSFHLLLTRQRRKATEYLLLFAGLGIATLSTWFFFGSGLSVVSGVSKPSIIGELRTSLLSNPDVLLVPLTLTVATIGALLVISRQNRWHKHAAVMMVLILCVDLMLFGSSYNSTGNKGLAQSSSNPSQNKLASNSTAGLPSAPSIEFLKSQTSLFRTGSSRQFFDNYLQTHRVEDIAGYLSIYPRSYAEFIFLTQDYRGTMPAWYSRWLRVEYIGHPLLSMAGMKYYVVPKGAALAHPDYRKVYDEEVTIFENVTAFDRAYFVCRASYHDTKNELFQALSGVKLKTLQTRVFLSSPPLIATDMNATNTPCKSEVSISQGAQGQLEIELSSNRDGYLVIANQFNPNWKLSSEDEQWPLVRANHTFIASPQPAGSRRLSLTYDAGWYGISYKINLVLWSLIGAMLALYFLRYYWIRQRDQPPIIRRTVGKK